MQKIFIWTWMEQYQLARQSPVAVALIRTFCFYLGVLWSCLNASNSHPGRRPVPYGMRP